MKPESSLLPSDWNVPAHLRARLGDAAGRQRVLEEDGHLVLVLHAPPGADEAVRRGRFFWRTPDGKWRAAPKAERIATLEEHLDEYRDLIEKLETDAETARTAKDYFELLDQLAPLSRSTRNLYDVLQQAREAVRGDRRLILARDYAYELMRRAELLYHDAKNGLDFTVAWQAEQQSESSHQMSVAAYRLNVLVAFFFPIATIMTILGANMRHGLEGWDEWAAPLPLLSMLAVGLLCGVLLTAFVTRTARRPRADLPAKSAASAARREDLVSREPQ